MVGQQSHFERMVALADEFFGTRGDPDQIKVTPEVMERLGRLHPATMGEIVEGDGPVAWMLVIPTTDELMEGFLSGQINERQLLELTPPNIPYTSVYLCSALVLPEYRRKGLSRKLALDAVKAIRLDHPIATLFVWSWSPGGNRLAREIAASSGLPLKERESSHET